MKIDNQVPIPPLGEVRDNRTKYPFREMEVGDSIFVDGEEDGYRAKAAAVMMTKRSRLTFKTQRENNGVRIWRVS